MNLDISIDEAAWAALPEARKLVSCVVDAVLDHVQTKHGDAALSVALLGDRDAAALNLQWRGKRGATNVLSFPAPAGFAVPPDEPRPLGDVVIAAEVAAREAQDQGKSLADHTAHLVVHGLLHLLGYDHIEDENATIMEDLEVSILSGLKVPNPYRHTW